MHESSSVHVNVQRLNVYVCFSAQTGPLLQCAASAKRMTAGHWSVSRPGVFYIAKQDGTLDVWDLLDRTHEPSMSQSITPAPITAIYPWQVTSEYSPHHCHLPLAGHQ